MQTTESRLVSQPPSVARQRNGFDTLRLLGALIVLVGHAFIITGHAAPMLFGRQIHQLGVWIFFVISGFLIMRSWIGDPVTTRYIRKRALRILPGLWLLLIGSVFVIGPIATTLPAATYFTRPATYIYLFKDAMLLTGWSLPGVFDKLPMHGQMNGSLWSLAIEVGLYLCVPIIFALHGRARTLTLLLLLFLPVPIILAQTAAPALFDRGFFGVKIGWGLMVAPLFAAGSLLQLVGFTRWDDKRRHRLLIASLICLLIGALGLPAYPAAAILIALPFALVTIRIGCSRWLHLPLLDRIGDLSYGIYLWAYPVQQLVYQRSGGGPALNILMALPLVLTLAFLSWHLVERPAMRWKPRPRSDGPREAGLADRSAQNQLSEAPT